MNDPIFLASLGVAAILVALGSCTPARAAPGAAPPGLAAALGFEEAAADGTPKGWEGGPPGTRFSDDRVVHGGKRSARIERTKASPGELSALTLELPFDVTGKTVELRGVLRTEDVHGFAGLWLREDGNSGMLALDNMQERALAGTTPWTSYSIALPVDPDTTGLAFGVLLQGTGKVWADDLELLVDGKPIWLAPRAARAQTVLDRDHAFDHGSGIRVSRLTPAQVEDLVLLGKVWGFLKYHHPKITSGQLHWDYELLRELPRVLALRDLAATQAEIVRWIGSLGPVPACSPCAKLDESDLALRPELAWLDDPQAVGPALGRALHEIFARRVPDQQFYVSQIPGVGNPQFLHELPYREVALPDPGFQLLALFRFWSAVRYWAPDRDLAGDWDAVLRDELPEVMLAPTTEAYQQALMATIARLHDSHAALWSSLDVRPPEGKCELAIDVRSVEGRWVIANVRPGGDEARALRRGDVLTALDGTALDTLVARWQRYYSGSNDASVRRDLARGMTRGPCGATSVGIERAGKPMTLTVHREAPADSRLFTHDLPGPTFRLLSKDVAYLKLSSVRAADVAGDILRAKDTQGLIVDIRNYPSEFVVFALGSLLVDRETPFVQFTSGDLSNPGAFHWSDAITLSPARPHYAGKVVVLVDEDSQSQAEYTAMALRASPRAIVLGSTTAGADGNISPLALPGGFSTAFSGLGVYTPARQPTQRVGIAPDVIVTPTIAGIRAGRDEVLEAAIRQILPAASNAEIERMARP